MSFIKTILFSFIFLSSLFCVAQPGDSIKAIVYYKRIIKTLADDSMRGREVSSVYETKAAEFIQKEFKKINRFKPLVHSFSYIHPDSLIEKKSKNVYCFINNKADSTVLIGAHYDHIGLGGKLSFSLSKKNEIHNGADDNASGIALLLSLAKSMKLWQNKKYNYLFVAYSAHEIGLYGSTAFYEFSKNKYPPICKAINFDMVGRLNNKYPNISIFESDNLNPKVVKTIDSLATLKLKLYPNKEGKIKDTDCRVFEKNNIQSVSFTTGTHNDYHKVTDDESLINYYGILSVQNFMEYFLKDILLKN